MGVLQEEPEKIGTLTHLQPLTADIKSKAIVFHLLTDP
jgi:hypothetical protein